MSKKKPTYRELEDRVKKLEETLKNMKVDPETGTHKKGSEGYTSFTRNNTENGKLYGDEEKYQLIFEKSRDALLLLDPEKGYIDCNQAALDLFKIPDRPTFEGLNPAFLSPEYQPNGKLSSEEAKKRVERILEEGALMFEWVHKKMDGQEFEANVLATKLEFKGKPLLLGSIRNITESEITEKELEITKAYFQAALMQSPSGILIADAPNVKIRFANPAAFGIRGKTDTLLTDIHVEEHSKKWNTYYADGITPYKSEDLPLSRAIIKGETANNIELIIKNDQGEKRWVSTNAAPIRDKNNNIVSGIVVFHDITDKKNVEEILKIEKEFTDTVLDSQQDTFFLFDPTTGRAIRWNKAFREISGYSDQEISGLIAPNSYYGPKDLVKAGKFVENVLKVGKGVIELELICKDGRKVPTEYNVSVVQDDEGEARYIISIGRDITERRQAEKKLKAKNEEYIALNEKLKESLKHIKKINVELKEAKERAVESDKLKTAFLANMSHEIRTPMNGILGFADLLKNPNLKDSTQKMYVEVIESSGNRMLSIINDLIDISKIESGQIELNIAELCINKIIDELYHFFKPQVESKGLLLIHKKGLHQNDCNIRADKDRLSQVLSNLINNAVKFTRKGKVEFGYLKKSSHLEFYVADTGIGIPPDMSEYIFERFRQVESSISRGHEGSGLGLSISKALVNMHGGEIWVESEKNKGATFKFTLPYYINSTHDSIEERELELLHDSIKEKYVKVLVVEDDEISRLYLKEILEKKNIEVVNAYDGVEAVHKASSDLGISLVLMDIKLPVLDGFEATKRIKLKRPELPVIAQTAFAQPTDELKAMQAGCVGYITKPVKDDHLIKLISKYI